MNEYAEHLANKIVKQRDKIIMQVLKEHVGELRLVDFSLLHSYHFRDGAESFNYDGYELVRFFPVEVRTECDGFSVKTYAQQNYFVTGSRSGGLLNDR